ncbi:MAG: hypothetical protein WAV53_09965 [Anaerolineae bacterium]
MASPWQRFLRPDYLLDPAPPLGRAWPLFLLLAGLFLGGLLWAWQQRSRGRVAQWEGVVCAAGLLLTLARLFNVPALSVRLWPLLALGLALLIALGYRLTRRPWGDQPGCVVRVLALQPIAADRARALAWLAGLLPMTYPALIAAVRLALPSGLEAQVQANLLPDPWILPFDLPAALLTGLAFTLLCLGSLILLPANSSQRPTLAPDRALALVILVTILLWAARLYVGQRTAGVSASDPYAYAQMAVDVAGTGSPLHRFTLFPALHDAGVPWYPMVHVGYALPLDAAGTAATVWPPGWPLLLAVPYRLWGEPALYLTAPLLGLLAVALSAWFVHLVAGAEGARLPWTALAGALTAWLLATSFEQVDRLLVPMADVSAQIFSLLALACGLWAWRNGARRPMRWGLAGGVCFGLAYLIRHTQLFLALPIALLVWLAPATSLRQRLRLAVGFALGALPLGLADLWYHWRLSGAIWQPESPESFLFSLAHIGRSAAAVLAEALRHNEWGLLWPLTLLGAWYLARRAPRVSAVLGLTVLALLAIHLPYGALRLRDLLSLFPLLALFTAWGAVAVLAQARAWAVRAVAGQIVAALAVAVLIFALAARTYPVLTSPWRPPHASFGFVSAAQRAAFAQVAALTEPDAIIGATLNSGALDLLSDRRSVRPADWTSAQWATVIETLHAQGRAVYLLDDGVDLAPVLEATGRQFGLTPVALLDVPVYGDPDRVSRTLFRVSAPQTRRIWRK